MPAIFAVLCIALLVCGRTQAQRSSGVEQQVSTAHVWHTVVYIHSTRRLFAHDIAREERRATAALHTTLVPCGNADKP